MSSQKSTQCGDRADDTVDLKVVAVGGSMKKKIQKFFEAQQIRVQNDREPRPLPPSEIYE